MMRADRLISCALAVALAMIALMFLSGTAKAQSPSCTSLTIGQTQEITAFSVCKKVTLASVPAAGAVGICVPTNIDAAQWASFYNNPPPGVTIAACGGGCSGGYSYSGYCYRWIDPSTAYSCDMLCGSYGGCNLAGTRFIGSDDSSGVRCGAVVSALTGTSVTAAVGSGNATGCYTSLLKGGYTAFNYYSPATTCANAMFKGRICACNN